MKQIEEMIQKNIEEKFNNGTIEKMINDSVERMIKEILDNATRTYSKPAKMIESKIEEGMCKTIESFDFSKYVTKITDVLDKILTCELLKDNRRIANNLQEILSFEKTDKKISMKDIFDKYCKMIESTETINYNDCYDSDDGTTTVTCKLEREGHSKYTLKAFTDKNEELEDCTIKFNICFDHIHGVEVEDIRSIRYLNPVETYLMMLQQNYCEITDILEYEEDVYVSVES